MMLPTSWRPTRAVLFACIGLPAWVAPLAAQGRYSGQVAGQLEEAEEIVAAQGYTLDGRTEGWMLGDEASTTTWSLIPGDWAVVGACDEDCGDVDLVARAASGRELDQDAATDALPVLMFSVDEATEVSLRLTMPGCDTRRCYVGFRWYHREAGSDGASAASGGASWRAIIGAQFGMIDLADATLEHERIELMDAEGTDSFSLNLEPGRYSAVAVCDMDCTDVDLFVRDGGGSEIGKDILADDVPVVEFTVGSDTAFRFDVDMAECSTSSCGYGFRLYRMGS